tara:strand:- start:616 stop:867 length:252 start_codon:yes stop_codon:yes gene_type:complete
MIIRKKDNKPKGWFESWLDDTNIIEKLIFMIWFTLPYFLFLMLDGIPNIWIKVTSTIGIFVSLSLLIYGFAVFMSSDERDWNR